MPRGRSPRRLELKFRVKPLVRMPVSVMLGKIQEFARTGTVPGDIEIAYMEYAHARGRSYSPGQRIQGHDWDEFRKFAQVLLSIQPEEVQGVIRSGKYKPNPIIRIGEPD